jgi:molybdate transport system regulatory protein
MGGRFYPQIARMPRSTFQISSAIKLETRLGGFANPRWMALLASIDETGSITAAAKVAGLSYKAAWDAIDAMNNLAGKPVVATAVGGKGGGGARLSAHGRKLHATYRIVEQENARFLAGINSKLKNADRELRILGGLSMRTSARNQWSGKVTRIRRGAVNDEVEIKLAGGVRIASIVTHESVENLGLELGQDAIALVKASSVLVGIGDDKRLSLSARNQLAGKVARVTPGAVNTEIVIGLRGGNTVAAVITNGAAKDLKLAVGQRALAILKASSVILGVA